VKSLRAENDLLEKTADTAARTQKKLEQEMKALVKDNKRKEHELQTVQHKLEQLEINHKAEVERLRNERQTANKHGVTTQEGSSKNIT
jgi:predicted  nucleic acid-binding Zn-ribbon protein